MRWIPYLAVVAALIATAVWVVSALRAARSLPPRSDPAPGSPAELPPDRSPPDWSPPGRLAPGWYDDPLGAHRLRYWDGRSWTEDTAD